MSDKFHERVGTRVIGAGMETAADAPKTYPPNALPAGMVNPAQLTAQLGVSRWALNRRGTDDRLG